ncbi:MAG: glycosyl hydrolase, family 5 [Hyphomicrobiales bacterium]|nr:glycosyl hydrolase, family 5 [Hyphomicrobiales bacterium]
MSRLFLGLFVALSVIAGVVLAVLPGRGGATAFVHARGTQILAPDGSPLRVRGIGLGNWLVPEGYLFGFENATSPRQIAQVFREIAGPEAANAFWRGWRTAFVGDADLAWLARSGFNVVRIPFDYRLWTPEDQPGLWTDEGFAVLDPIVASAARNGLYVMLDMHAAPCGQNGQNIDNSDGVAHLYTDEACVRRAGDVWERIARHYAGDPTIAGYELLNEPAPVAQGDVSAAQVMARITRELATRIRHVDTHHLIFDNSLSWREDNPAPEPGIVPTFHLYWEEVKPDMLRRVLDFRARTGSPILMSESGENSDDWVRAFRETLEAQDIGWIFWPYKKLDAPSAPRSFDTPPYWEEIVAYQALIERPARERLAQRPPVEHARSALDGLLASVQFGRTRVNDGYMRALGVAQ